MGVAVLGGLLGAALVAFGARMLILRRAPALIGRSFRTVREAGCYHLLFGVALLLFVFGGTAASLVAVALVGVAVLRFRPRGRKHDDE
ncbi:hypothetical protein AB0M02_07580 [Actinoplanes sp. NPDC051861]|uniref:hypothetical protein n=1 Tax=Actinoplanes sp. NPDC051861 TaxID=3155170 RepID=UPI0034308248